MIVTIIRLLSLIPTALKEMGSGLEYSLFWKPQSWATLRKVNIPDLTPGPSFYIEIGKIHGDLGPSWAGISIR